MPVQEQSRLSAIHQKNHVPQEATKPSQSDISQLLNQLKFMTNLLSGLQQVKQQTGGGCGGSSGSSTDSGNRLHAMIAERFRGQGGPFDTSGGQGRTSGSSQQSHDPMSFIAGMAFAMGQKTKV